MLNKKEWLLLNPPRGAADGDVETEQPTLEPTAPPPEPVVDPPPAEPAAAEKPRNPLAFLDERVNLRRAELEAGHADIFPDAKPAPTPEPIIESEPAAPAPPVQAPAATPLAAPAPAPAVVSPQPTAAGAPQPKLEAEKDDWRTVRQMKRLEKILKNAGMLSVDENGMPVLASTVATAKPAPAPILAPVAPTPASDDDPFGVNRLTAIVETERQRNDRLEAQQTQIQRTAVINDQIRTFEVEHPDYKPALDHLVASRQEEYRVSGIGDVEGAWLLADKRWTPAIEKAQDILSEKQNRYVTEEEAARELAIERKINEEADQIIAGTLKRGGSVPATIWELARQRGYQSSAAALLPPLTPVNGAALGPTSANGAPAPSAVAEKVRQQSRASAATKSISNVSSASASPGQMPKPINSLPELQAFLKRDPEGARRWINEQTQRDPRWHTKLSAQ